MKMIFTIILLIVAGIVLTYLFFYLYGILTSPDNQQKSSGSVCFGNPPTGGCFEVELAKTQQERDRGLMYRKELGKDKGMLFIFDQEGIYPFWMKNTLIPLDIIWIDSNKMVVFISENVQPCKSLICPSVTPSSKAKYVLEINAGLCNEIGLKVGDVLDVNIKDV